MISFPKAKPTRPVGPAFLWTVDAVEANAVGMLIVARTSRA